MRQVKLFVAVVVLVAWCSAAAFAAPPAPQQTLRAAAQVLEETRALQVRAIPDSLLKDAQAVAVVPSVVKIGVIVGGRHGRGIVVTRDQDGAWTAPTFVELTGGSVGWQLGVQSTDVVLVFKNKQGIENLLSGGKFTLGADAAVAAGPVGRQAAAATDAQLKAEVYSYSRSRGLFAGVALDGSVLSVDQAATAAFQQGGEAATEDVARLMAALEQQPTPAAGDGKVATVSTTRIGATQKSLQETYNRLQRRLPAEWREYLALAPELFAEQGTLSVAEDALKRYDRVAADAKYEALTTTAEFQETHALLGGYVAELYESGTVALPPPPRD